MLKRPIEGTTGPAQTAMLMFTQQQMENISQLVRSWTDYRLRGSNSWTGDLGCPCWRVGGPRRCQRCRCQCCRRCQEQEREQMQVLLQARAVLWIAVVTSSGDERYLPESKRSRRFSACDRCFPTCWHSSGPERCFSGGTLRSRAIQPRASRNPAIAGGESV